MKIDYGNKRSQIIIAGILVITVLSILVGFALVVGVDENYSQNNMMPLNSGYFNNSETNSLRWDTDVSVGKGSCICNVPTAAGTITATSWNLPFLSWAELPLCITATDIAAWSIVLDVTGGYEPQDGCITFKQEGESQYIYISWSVDDSHCCYNTYTASFSMDGNCITFDSSQDPIINLPFDYNYCGNIEDKLVNICWCVPWTGCDFYIILTHKMYPESPTSE